MQRDGLHPATYRYIEKILYDYTSHETAIAELEAHLDEVVKEHSKSVVVPSRTALGPRTSEPERHTILRNESVHARYLQGRIAERKRHRQIVEAARQQLDDLEIRLVYLKYDLGKSSRDCWRIMGLQKSRFYEIRREILCKVARYAGLI